MSDEIFFDGARYISANQASSTSSLTRDYIARLCRDGKVKGKRVGKNWYVDDSSFKEFLVHREYAASERGESLAQSRRLEYRGEESDHRARPHTGTSLDTSAEDVRKKLAHAVATHIAKIPSGLPHAAVQNLPAQAGVHAPITSTVPTASYTITPVMEFVHKLIALALAFTLTFGTFAVVNPSYARYAVESVQGGMHALADSYQAATEGDMTALAERTGGALVAAASNAAMAAANPGGFFSGITSVIGSLARGINTSVDSFVYGVMFPQDLFAPRGSAVVQIAPQKPAPTIAATAATSSSAIRMITTTSAPKTVNNQTVVNPPERTGSVRAGNNPIVEHTTEAQKIIVAGGITQEQLDLQLQQLDNKLSQKMYSLSSANSTQTAQVYHVVSQTNAINNLDHVAISNASFTGGSISGASVSATSLRVSGSASIASLTAGESTLATTTVDGDLTVTGAVNFTGGVLSTTNAAFTNATTTILSAGTASTTNLSWLYATGTNSIFTNATSTNLFSSIASSTNIYAQTARFGALGLGVATTTSGVLQTTGMAWVGGDLYVGGNATVIGASSATTLAVNSSIISDLVPDQNITRDLGSASYYWKTAYVGTLNANNISAASTTIGGTSNASFTLNSDNATADTEDMDLIFFRGTVVPNALLSWDSTLDRFAFNQPLFIQSASGSTTIPTFSLQGLAGQTANIFQVASSTGTVSFAVGSDGAVTIATTTILALTSGTTTLTNLSVTNTSTSTFAGGLSTATFSASGLSTLSNTFLTNATSTNLFSTLASSTNLFAQTASLGSLAIGGLSTFTNGFLSLASSTITSGLFSMNGGASTTNFTASGTGYFGNGAFTNATTSALFSTTASSTNLFSQVASIGNATSTNLFSTLASSTNLYAQTASLGSLSLSSTLGITGLATFTNGFLSLASSTVTSGLFSMNGGASTTNFTASGTGWLGNGVFTNTSGTTTIASGQGFTIGTSQLVVQQGSGNLGIGTASPHFRLTNSSQSDVQDQGLLGLAGSNSLMWEHPSSDAATGWTAAFLNSLSGNNADGLLVRTTDTSADSKILVLNSNGTDRLTVLGSGNVGIAQIAPTYKLDVTGTGHISSYLDASYIVATSSSLASIFNGGFLSLASSTITSGLFSMNGGASTTNFTASGTGWLGNGVFTNTSGTTTIASGQGFTIGDSQFVVQQGSGYVGIGTASPSAPFVLESANIGSGKGSLLIEGNFNTERVELRSAGATPGPAFQGRGWGGTIASPTATQSGMDIFILGGSGFDGTNIVTSNSSIIKMTASENWTSTANGSYIHLDTTPNGLTTASRAERLRISDAGNIGIGTTTPFWNLTVASSSGPQLALVDTTASSNAWTLRSISNSFYLATSTALATSTTAALAINPNGAAIFGNNLTVNGTSAFTGLLTLTNGFVSQASSTVVGDFTNTGFINTSGTGGGYQIDGKLILTASSTLGNLSIGLAAGAATTTTGTANIAVGLSALAALTSGTNNTALGYQAGRSITSQTGTTFLGYQAGLTVAGNNVTCVGSGACSTLTGKQNTALGTNALLGGGAGEQNVGIGFQVGTGLTTGSKNVFIGVSTASSTASGSNNIAIGYDILLPSVNGSNQLNIGNLIFGTNVDGQGTTLSSGNVGIGTTTPSNALTVANATLPQLALVDTTASSNAWTLRSISNSFYLATSTYSATSTTAALAINPNGGVTLANTLFAQSSGNVGINNIAPRALLDVLSGTANTTGDVISTALITGANASPLGGTGNLFIQTNDDFAIDKGGSIAFGGRHTTSNTAGAFFAGIKGAKENSTSASLGGYLAFYSRGADSPWTVSEAMRITSSGNVGIGTTSPQGQLVVVPSSNVSAIRIDSTGGFTSAQRFDLNSVQYLTLGSAGSNDAGLLGTAVGDAFVKNQQANALLFGTNNTERMRITSAGNVGIGTTSPATTLSVAGSGYFTGGIGAGFLNTTTGTIKTTTGQITAGENTSVPVRILGGSTFAELTMNGNATGGSNYTFLSDTAHLYINRPSGGDINFREANGTSQMVIKTSTGNVGIGTTTPQLPLVLGDGQMLLDRSAGAYERFTVNYAENGYVGNASPIFGGSIDNFGIRATNNLVFGIGATEYMRLNSSGNVGIGTTSPKSQLQIWGAGQNTAALTDSGNTGGMLTLSDTSSGAGNGGALGFGAFGGGSDTIFAAIKGLLTNGTPNHLGDLAFSTRNATGDTALTERMRINNSGNVGIGTTSPATFAVLHVEKDQDGLTASILSNSNSGTASAAEFDVSTNGVVGNGLRLITTGANYTNTSLFSADKGLIVTDTDIANGLVIDARASGAPLNLMTGDVSRLYIDSGGLVGIGTTSPANTLHVAGNITVQASTQSSINFRAANSVGGFLLGRDFGGTDAQNFFLYDNVAGAARMYVDSGGLVGIGTTSPQTILHIGTTDQSSNRLRLENRGSGGRTWDIVGGLPATNNSSFSIYDLNADATRLTIDSSGNVNIGTSANTSAALFVQGGGGLGVTGDIASYSANSIYLDNTASSRSRIQFTGADASTNGTLSILSTRGDGSSAVEAMTILGSGNVGIGTTTPQTNLVVSGADSSNYGQLQIWSTGNDARLSLYNSNGGVSTGRGDILMSKSDGYQGMRFMINNSDKMILSKDGYLGIGTTSPAALFSITGGTGNYFDSSGYVGLGRVPTSVFDQGGAGAPRLTLAHDDTVTTFGGGQPALAIVNTNGATSTSAHILFAKPTQGGNIEGNAAIIADFVASNAFGASMAAGANVYPATDLVFTTGGSGGTINQAGVERLRITSYGHVVPGADNTETLGSSSLHWDCVYYDATVTGTCASDARLKGNIADFSLGADPLGQLSGLRPRTFTYNDNPAQTVNYGFVAQEVLTVAPEMVELGSDGYYQVKYGYLPYLTLAALQQLNAKVDSLAMSATSSVQIYVDAAGNVGIGTTTAGTFPYKLNVAGSVAAEGFVNISARGTKTDIASLGSDTENDILNEINSTTVFTYHYKDESGSNPMRMGLITDSAPSEVLSPDGGGVDIYKLAAFTFAGLKAEDRKVDALALRVDNLEKVIQTLADQPVRFNLTGSASASVVAVLDAVRSLGSDIAANLAHFVKVLADNLQVGTAEHPTGITMYDKTTGSPYCFQIDSGEATTTPGACADIIVGAQTASAGTSGGDVSIGSEATPPVIEVQGNNPATIQVGDSYNDLGALITGPTQAEMNLGIQVVVDGGATTTPDMIQIDTAVAGTHSIIYSATTQEGLTGYAERTVVVETPAPASPPADEPADSGNLVDTGEATSTSASSGDSASTTDATSTTP